MGKVLTFCPETNTMKGFSGDHRMAEEIKSASKLEDILWRRLEPAAALDLVERLCGEELWRELRGRQAVKESKAAKRGVLVAWMEKKLRCVGTYQPFLWEEGDVQVLLPWHVGYYRV